MIAGADGPTENPPMSPEMIEEAPSPPLKTAPDDTIVALFTRLVDNAETFVRAEIRLYRANVFSRLSDARTAIIMLLASFLIAQSAIIALLVGLVVILRPALGGVGATATVVIGGVSVAGLLAGLAINKIRQLTDIKGKPPRGDQP